MPYWLGLINGKGRYDTTTYSLLIIFNVDAGKAYTDQGDWSTSIVLIQAGSCRT